MVGQKKANKKYSISVFFPCYRDEGAIEKMVLDAISTVKPLAKSFEIIVVDDASPDNAGKIADGLAKKFKQVKVVHHKKNRGYGGALKSGFKAATKELIFYTDGDGQYNVKELPKLLPFIEDYDVVTGFKLRRSDGIGRVVFGRGYYYFVKLFFGLKIKDVNCAFKLLKKKVVDSIKLESNEGVICVEMIKKIQDKGFSIKELPVHHYQRLSGKSQFFKPQRVIKTLVATFFLWLNLVVKKKLGLARQAN